MPNFMSKQIQNQLAKLFYTSKQKVSLHKDNILKERDLNRISVVKYYLTTAPGFSEYTALYYPFTLILTVCFLVGSTCNTITIKIIQGNAIKLWT